MEQIVKGHLMEAGSSTRDPSLTKALIRSSTSSCMRCGKYADSTATAPDVMASLRKLSDLSRFCNARERNCQHVVTSETCKHLDDVLLLSDMGPDGPCTEPYL